MMTRPSTNIACPYELLVFRCYCCPVPAIAGTFEGSWPEDHGGIVETDFLCIDFDEPYIQRTHLCAFWNSSLQATKHKA
jgi:hypothetical protein